MKKTFQETAREYADSVINSFGRNGVPNGISDIKEMLVLAFENGSEWQAKRSPWISVKERLPESNITVLTKGAYGHLICFLSTLGEWETNANVNDERLAITHWMPIPPSEETIEVNKDNMENNDIKKLVLGEEKKGNIVYNTPFGLYSAKLDTFLSQSTESILYDLNRDFGTILAQIDDVKWVNDYALSKVVIELKKRLAEAEENLKEQMENNK